MGMHLRARAVAVVAAMAVASAALVVAPARGADNWAAAQDLPGAVSGAGRALDVAISDDGTKAVAVWSQFDSGTSRYAIQAAVGRVAGSLIVWGSATTLSDTAVTSDEPQVALSADPTGGVYTAVAVWTHNSDADPSVYSKVATIPSGTSTTATWGSATVLAAYDAATQIQGARTAKVAISDDGTKATALWLGSDDEPQWIARSDSATISGTTATWSGTTATLSLAACQNTPPDPTCATNAMDPALALSADGTKALAIWSQQDAASAISGSGAKWSATTISGNTHSWTPRDSMTSSGTKHLDVAMAEDGSRVGAIFTRWAGSALEWRVYSYAWHWDDVAAAYVSDGQSTIMNNPTAGNADESLYPRIDVSADGGMATAIWFERSGDGSSPYNRVSKSATTYGDVDNWSTAAAESIGITDPAAISPPAIVVSDDGTRATVAFARSDGSDLLVSAASASVSGTTATWGSAYDLSTSGGDADLPALAGDADGNRVVAAWSRDDGSNWIPQASGAMAFVPGAPGLSYDSGTDTLTITPDADTGGSTVTGYQILYNTPARVTAGKNWGIWAVPWPAADPSTDPVSINLETYKSNCDGVSGVQRCFRPVGTHELGGTYVYRVGAINGNGLGSYAELEVTRPASLSSAIATPARSDSAGPRDWNRRVKNPLAQPEQQPHGQRARNGPADDTGPGDAAQRARPLAVQ